MIDRSCSLVAEGRVVVRLCRLLVDSAGFDWRGSCPLVFSTGDVAAGWRGLAWLGLACVPPLVLLFV